MNIYRPVKPNLHLFREKNVQITLCRSVVVKHVLALPTVGQNFFVLQIYVAFLFWQLFYPLFFESLILFGPEVLLPFCIKTEKGGFKNRDNDKSIVFVSYFEKLTIIWGILTWRNILKFINICCCHFSIRNRCLK